jgi:penicillin-binding protein-related factor A (putative recombinase)
VVKASLNGTQVPRDFDRIAEYYYQHYKSTMDRLFAENGYAVDFEVKKDDTTKTNTD